MDYITDLVRQYEEAKPHADPVTRNWFLLNNSPVYVWAISIVYLAISVFGPSFMRNRKAWNVPTWFIVFYNMGCVFISLYMAVEIILIVIENEIYKNIICVPYTEKSRTDPKEYRMKCVLYWYFFSKSIELIDTVLMVVRKKNSQITFLHVFHHVSMLNIWWWVMMFIPSGSSYFGALMNSSVHVVMYSYYGLAAIPSLRDKLWWKRYITKFQLLQFIITFVHSYGNIYTKCDFPEWGKVLLTGYMVVLFSLFVNFYIKSYLSRKPRSQKQLNGAHITGTVTNGKSTNAVSSQNGLANGDSISEKKSM